MHWKYKERNNEIYALRTDKLMTLTAIGKMYGLTRERIRVIVNKVEEKNASKDLQNIRSPGDREVNNAIE